MIDVGVAMREVAVPVGTPMSGFAARLSASTGTHDPLTVRALVVGAVAIVTVDCCALHERTCAELRERTRGDGVEELIVHATHTHAGPCISVDRLGTDSPAVRRRVMDAVADAVREAARRRIPCAVNHAQVRGTGVAKNRRHPERAVDPPVQVIGFERDGERVATLVSYPCHPVVLDRTNTLISADYVGPLRRRVEAASPGSICVFLTGAAGDINTGHSAEASFVSRGGAGRTFAEAERVGEVLAEAAVRATPHPIDAGQVRYETAGVELAFEEVSAEAIAADVREWEREIAAGSDRAALLSVWRDWASSAHRHDDAWRGRVSVVSIGDVRLVALPGEPFLEAAERLRRVHDGPVLVAGYCDGVPGYLPSAGEYAHGGYEVRDAHRYYAMPAPFAQGSLERVIDTARAVMERV